MDYIQVDGERIVDTIYTVDQLNELLADVSRHIGQSLFDVQNERESKAKNRTIVFRNDLIRHIIEASRPTIGQLSKLMSERVKYKIRNTVYVPRDKRLKATFGAEYVRTFICNYYSEDTLLYHNAIKSRNNEAL